MGGPAFHPAPAAGVQRPQPLLPELAAAKAAAQRVGEEYGKFREWAENFFALFDPSATGGVNLWDRLTPERRLEALAKVQAAFDTLPKLPIATSNAMAAVIREGFAAGATQSYEAERFQTRAVWVGCELAKNLVLVRGAMPRALQIAAYTDKFRDCAAQTAARAIREVNGASVDPAALVRAFGLPKVSINGYEAARAYCLNWFEMAGIKLAPRGGGFMPVSGGGVSGKYVIFMRGGATGGHVVYGEVADDVLLVVDNQIGKSWTSLEAAKRALGMEEVTHAYRIMSVVVP